MAESWPAEPPPSPWSFRLDGVEQGEDLVGVGGDLMPGTLLAAYRGGLFPMGLGEEGGPPLGWWSPDPRGVLLPGRLKTSRSLRRACRRFDVRVDTAFEDVVAACADPARDGRWITGDIAEAYLELHRLGWAHSVETWRGGRLVGGLYGVAVGGLFAGESMFHHETDASKVALAALCSLVLADGDTRRLVDVQWATPHLRSLGVTEVPRADYLRRLSVARRLRSPELRPGQVPEGWTVALSAPTPDTGRDSARSAAPDTGRDSARSAARDGERGAEEPGEGPPEGAATGSAKGSAPRR